MNKDLKLIIDQETDPFVFGPKTIKNKLTIIYKNIMRELAKGIILTNT